jgi:hypothetical protein
MDIDRAEPILTSTQIDTAMDALSTALAETGVSIGWDANRRGEVTFTVAVREPALVPRGPYPSAWGE